MWLQKNHPLTIDLESDMSYFANHPVIAYPFDTFRNGTELRVVKDIVLNVRFVKEIINGIQYFDEYDIPEGHRIEMVAEKLYGDPNLHWVLMLLNERYDYLNDFPVDEETLEKYVELKYGEGNRNQIHQLFGIPHYENEFGDIVTEDSPLAVPITNYEYEFRVNESKRRIKVIDKSLITQVVRELENAFLQQIENEQ